MCSQQSVDALFSATYVDDFLDCVEGLPNQIQHHLSEVRRLDVNYFECMKKMKRVKTEIYGQSLNNTNVEGSIPSATSMITANEARSSNGRRSQTRGLFLKQLRYLLLQSQRVADGKLAELAFVSELIGLKTRQLEHDSKNMELEECDGILNGKPSNTETTSERPIRSIMRGYMRGDKDRFTNLNPPSDDIQQTRSEKHQSTVNYMSIGAAVISAMASEAESEAPSPSTSSSVAALVESVPCSGSGPRPMNKRPRRQKQFPDFVRTEVDAAMLTISTVNGSNGSTSPLASTAAAISAGQRNNRERSSGGSGNTTQATKRKKKKQKPDGTAPSGTSGSSGKMKFNLPVDPDEPTYCLCEQVSYGEMIGCDNSDCDLEWFHFNCVGLTSKPKGKWYCPKCRGDRPNVMKHQSCKTAS